MFSIVVNVARTGDSIVVGAIERTSLAGILWKVSLNQLAWITQYRIEFRWLEKESSRPLPPCVIYI